MRYGDPQSKRYDLQRTQGISDVKDGEFEGDKQPQKGTKANVTAPFGLLPVVQLPAG